MLSPVNVGIDLGMKSAHKAVGFDSEGRKVTEVVQFLTHTRDLEELIFKMGSSYSLRFLMEPTGMVWFPVAHYLLARGYEVFLVSAEKVHDLRKFYSKHAKNDRLDAETLARMPFICPEALIPPSVNDARINALKRWVKLQGRLTHSVADSKRRIMDLVNFAVPDLRVNSRMLFSALGRQLLKNYLDPRKVKQKGSERFKKDLMPYVTQQQGEKFIEEAYEALCDAALLYESDAVDLSEINEELGIYLELLEKQEAKLKQVEERIQLLYESLHPSRKLETIYGVGKETAPVYVAALAGRKFNGKGFRSYCGVIPRTKQSGSGVQQEKMTKSGPPWLRRALFLSADTARKWDPQLAKIYYQQRMKGSPHTKALCAIMARLADRIRKVYEEDRHYVLEDFEGNPISPLQARQVIEQHYKIPDSVRMRQRKWGKEGAMIAQAG